MLKFSAMTLGFIFCSTFVFAQKMPLFIEYKEQKVNRSFFGGIQLNMNATQIDGDGFSGYDKVGLNAGVSLHVFFNKNYGLELNMLYSEKGAINRQTYHDDYTGTGFINYEALVNYIEMPLLFTYYHQERMVFMAGPSLNLLIKEEEIFPYPNPPINYEPRFNKWTADILIGVKYNLWSNLYAQAKFSYGILAMRNYEVTGSVPLTASHQYNNQLTFGIQYLF